MPRSKRGALSGDTEDVTEPDVPEEAVDGVGDQGEQVNATQSAGNIQTDGDGAGDADQHDDKEGSDQSNGCPEAETHGNQMEAEFHKVIVDQRRILEALQQEQRAYSVERANLDKEREKMTELLAKAENVLAREVTTKEPVQRRVKTSNKCPKYNGETEWTAFLVQFETWMRLHGYDNEECKESWSDLLGLAMDGEAQVFFSGLSAAERGDYHALKSRLEQRYSGGGISEVFKAKLQSGSKRQPGESLSKLRDSFWLMARKGYPRLQREAQEQIAMGALMRAVDTDLRIQCSMKDCQTLDEAVSVMERYEAVIQADPERKRKAVKRVSQDEQAAKGDDQLKGFSDLCGHMTDMLNKQMELLTDLKKGQTMNAGKRRWQDKKDIECFRCGGKGHFARDCSQKKTDEGATKSENSRPPAGQ